MSDAIKVGIVAASSVVPEIELVAGLEHLRRNGFDPIVHEQVLKQHFTFAADDLERATAFLGYALSPNLDVIWMARGGYGAQRILPLLDELTSGKRGNPRNKPKKLLVGYSDVT